ncbi:MAG: HupE/UreJ family protein, partial [Pseudomonadales bacterium]
MRSILLLAGLISSGCLLAHEIPADVRVQVYLTARGDHVEALIRVPLVAMRDVELPLKGPGYLDLEHVEPELRTAAEVWLVNAMTIRADDRVLAAPVVDAVRVALPSDRSFASFDTARDAVSHDRLPTSVELYWSQALLDVALRYPNPAGAGAALSVDPRFARLGLTTVTTLTALLPDGRVSSLAFQGDPGRISLDPGVLEVLFRFTGEGFSHVLDGLDHLLFVLVLVVPLLVIRPLVVVVTAFTLAHSLTLGATALDLVPTAGWFPPLVEVLIAASIFYMALENILRPTLRRRWLEAFAFGLVHGFGFSFALRE